MLCAVGWEFGQFIFWRKFARRLYRASLSGWNAELQFGVFLFVFDDQLADLEIGAPASAALTPDTKASTRVFNGKSDGASSV